MHAMSLSSAKNVKDAWQTAGGWSEEEGPEGRQRQLCCSVQRLQEKAADDRRGQLKRAGEGNDHG